MDYTIKVEIALVAIVSPLAGSGNAHVLMLKEGRLPFTNLNNYYCIKDGLSALLLKYLNANSQWVQTVQGKLVEKVYDNERDLIIPFGCMIPEVIPIPDNAEWKPLSDLFKDNLISLYELGAIQDISLRL